MRPNQNCGYDGVLDNFRLIFGDTMPLREMWIFKSLWLRIVYLFAEFKSACDTMGTETVRSILYITVLVWHFTYREPFPSSSQVAPYQIDSPWLEVEMMQEKIPVHEAFPDRFLGKNPESQALEDFRGCFQGGRKRLNCKRWLEGEGVPGKVYLRRRL